MLRNLTPSPRVNIDPNPPKSLRLTSELKTMSPREASPLTILNQIADRYQTQQAELERLRKIEQVLLASPDKIWPELATLVKTAA